MRAVALIAFAASALAQTPRKAPELTIVEPSGKQIQLSSAKGSVCVVTFLLTTCQHCQHESEMLSKLYREMGSRGLKVFGVAINDNAQALVPQFVEEFGVAFPVGYAQPAVLNSFMQFSEITRVMMPQVAVIDRKGMIRAESPPGGDTNLQSEPYMRDLLDKLLKEGVQKK